MNGVQFNNLILASRIANDLENSQGENIRKYCILAFDEMIIVSGIVYSATEKRVYGLADLPMHFIQEEIFKAFYDVVPDNDEKSTENNKLLEMDDPSDPKYFQESSEKLKHVLAKGFIQVRLASLSATKRFIRE